jgi:hypothetical protein
LHDFGVDTATQLWSFDLRGGVPISYASSSVTSPGWSDKRAHKRVT